MSVYLIRHTTPLIDKGVCYGQADIDVTDSFHTEAAVIKDHIPQNIEQVYSSPLLRCRKLAEHLFPSVPVAYEQDLKEIHCGEWELQRWDDLPREVIDPWMNDFVNACIPGGESYVQLQQRVVRCFQQIAGARRPVVIISHGGVMRSILAHITQTPLSKSFGVFGLHYGCVVRLDEEAGGGFRYQVLSGGSASKEQHKPSPK